MSRHTMSVALVLFGIGLIASGCLSWCSGYDLWLHPLLRLAGPGVERDRVEWLSRVGSGFGMIPLVLLVVVSAASRRATRRWALWLALTVASGRLAVEGIKLVIRRDRPPMIDRLEAVTSWSFPSSHSAGTMMSCLAIAFVWGGRRWMLFVAFSLAGAIGATRLALAVHWPGDVLAGWGIAMLWVGGALRWAPPPTADPLSDRRAPQAEAARRYWLS